MNNQMINPVLSNYLVPRNERFKQDSMNNQMSYSEKHWGKKSEKTTNFSEMPHKSSNLESPEPYSIDQSIKEDSQRYYQKKSRENKNFSKRSKRKKTNNQKMKKKFKFGDSELDDNYKYKKYNQDKIQNNNRFYMNSQKQGTRRKTKKQDILNNYEENGSYNEYSKNRNNEENSNYYRKSRGYSTGRLNLMNSKKA